MSPRSLKNDSVSLPCSATMRRGCVAELGIGQVARRGERAEEQPGGAEHGEDRDQLDREPGLGELVAKAERTGLPEQEVGCLAHDAADDVAAGAANATTASEAANAAAEEQRHEQERRAERAGLVARRERRAARDEQRGAPGGERGLLDVEPLEDVEDREGEQQPDREVERSAPSPIQVVRSDDQRHRRGHGERMCVPHHRERLDVHELAPAPLDVRRHGREQVDEPDRGGRERCDGGDVVEVPARSKRRRAAVDEETPGGGVPALASSGRANP